MQTAFYSLVLFLCSTLYTYSQYSEIVKLDTSTYPQMKAEYLVFDRQGNISTDASLELYENGRFKKIKKQTPPQEIHKPLSVLIILDMSCRYDGIDGTPVQQIAQQWLEYIHPDDEIGIVVHDVKNTLVADYTNNALLLSEKLKTIETHPTDQRKESTPNDTLVRTRHLVTKAKNKAIIIFISQSFTPRYTSYWIETDSTVATYTINRERITPDYIRQVSEEAAGRNFNRTGNNTNLLYSRILYEARGGKPGMIEWDGEIYCEDGKKKLELYEAENDVRSSYDFYPSLRSINELHFSNEAIRFGGIEPGREAKKEVMIISTRRDLLIKNIHSRNPQYRIEPRSVFMEKGKPTVFTLYYKSEDSNYTWTRFSAESQECAFTFDASAGYPGKLPKKNELRIVYPTEKETIYYGEDFDIIWDGIADFEEVELYGDNNLITKNAKAKYRYMWKIPLYWWDSVPKRFSIKFCKQVTAPFSRTENDLKYVLSPNRSYLATISSDSVKVLDLKRRSEILSFSCNQSRYSGISFFSTLQFDPHSRYLAALNPKFDDVLQINSTTLEVWDINSSLKKAQRQYFSVPTLSPNYVFWDYNSENIHIPPLHLNHRWKNALNIRTGEEFYSSNDKLLKDVVAYSYSPNGKYIALLRTVLRKVEIYNTDNHTLVCKFYYDRNRGREGTNFDAPRWSYDSEMVFLQAQVTKDTSVYQLLMGNVTTKMVDTVNFEASGFVVGIVDCNPFNNYCTLFTTRYNSTTNEDTLRIVDFRSGKTIKKINGMNFGLWLEDGNTVTDGYTVYNIKTDERSFLKTETSGNKNNFIDAYTDRLMFRNPIKIKDTISQCLNSETLYHGFIKNVSKKGVRLRYLFTTDPHSTRQYTDSVFRYEFPDVDVTVEPDDSVDMRAYWYRTKSTFQGLPMSPLLCKFLFNNVLHNLFVYPYIMNDSNNKTILFKSFNNHYVDTMVYFQNNSNETIQIEYDNLIDNEHQSFSIMHNLRKRKVTPNNSLGIKVRFETKTEDTVKSRLVLHYKTGSWYNDNASYVYNLIGYSDGVSSIHDQQFSESFRGIILPNPASGIVSFTLFNNIEKHIDITVCDIWGNKVLSLFSGILMERNANFEIPKLHTGNYFVVVKSSDKSKVYPFVVTQ